MVIKSTSVDGTEVPITEKSDNFESFDLARQELPPFLKKESIETLFTKNLYTVYKEVTTETVPAPPPK